LLSNIHQNNDAIKSSCDNGSNRNINPPPSAFLSEEEEEDGDDEKEEEVSDGKTNRPSRSSNNESSLEPCALGTLLGCVE
jgi:hypothetical protein